MIRTGLRQDQVDEVRNRTNQFITQRNLTYGEAAARAHISESDVKNFLSCRRGTTNTYRIAAYLAAYLPLGLTFCPPDILPS